MDIGVNISESSPVRVISKLLEGLDYRYLMQAYSKNRQDATFMRMKEDYMKNGQLKPAYNL